MDDARRPAEIAFPSRTSDFREPTARHPPGKCYTSTPSPVFACFFARHGFRQRHGQHFLFVSGSPDFGRKWRDHYRLGARIRDAGRIEAGPDSRVDSVRRRAWTGSTALLVDLSHTKFFGSSFIEVLFRVWNRVNQAGGKFAICGLNSYCREVLQITHLDTVWKTFANRLEAQQWLAG